MDSWFTALIEAYYERRNLKWPTTIEAILWTITELGEVCEVLLAQRGGWTRNNPGDHQTNDSDALEEELGDAIMMLQVAGIARGLDPLKALETKIAASGYTL